MIYYHFMLIDLIVILGFLQACSWMRLSYDFFLVTSLTILDIKIMLAWQDFQAQRILSTCFQISSYILPPKHTQGEQKNPHMIYAFQH